MAPVDMCAVPIDDDGEISDENSLRRGSGVTRHWPRHVAPVDGLSVGHNVGAYRARGRAAGGRGERAIVPGIQ
jgi:hypothetical protein